MTRLKIPDLNGMGKRKVVVAPPVAVPAIPAVQVATKGSEAKPQGDASRAPVRQILRKAVMARNAELSRLPHARQALLERNAVLNTQPSFRVGT